MHFSNWPDESSHYNFYVHVFYKLQNLYIKSLLICESLKKYSLFVWVCSSQSRIFHSYEDITITSKELYILSYARQSWPLSSEGSLACHTYCDSGHLFIMVISSQLLPSDSNAQPPACGANALSHCKNTNDFEPTFKSEKWKYLC